MELYLERAKSKAETIRKIQLRIDQLEKDKTDLANQEVAFQRIQREINRLESSLPKLYDDLEQALRKHAEAQDNELYLLSERLLNIEDKLILTNVFEALDSPGHAITFLRQDDIDIFREALKVVQDGPIEGTVADTFHDAVDKASDIINSEMELSGKFKLTIPIIPMLLSYDVKLGGTVKGNLTKLWRKIKSSFGRRQ